LPIFPQIPSTALEEVEDWQVYKDFSKPFPLMKYRITVLYYSSLSISHYFFPFFRIIGAIFITPVNWSLLLFSSVSICSEAKNTQYLHY